MKQGKSEAVNFDDKIVIVPVELARDRQVPGEALALFTVMKSFGPRAEAKVETYGSRLHWSPDKVKKYQRVLEKAQWIVLLREGQKLRKDEYLPRLWWMCRVKGEQPPQGGEVGGGNSRPPTKKAPLKVGPLDPRGPQNNPPEAVEGSSSSRRNLERESQAETVTVPEPSLNDAPTDPEAILQQLDPARQKKYGRTLTRNDQNATAAIKAAKAYGPDLVQSYNSYLADPGREGRLGDSRHPLNWFADQPDTYLPIRSNAAAAVPEDPAMAKERRRQEEREALDRVELLLLRQQQLQARWEGLGPEARAHVLELVKEEGPFMADLVRKHQGDLFESDMLVAALRDKLGLDDSHA